MRIMHAIDIMQRLCGSKHPEARHLAEDLYAELNKQLLMKKEPSKIPLKLASWKLAPSYESVKDAKINPCLVKKTSLNSLKLPTEI